MSCLSTYLPFSVLITAFWNPSCLLVSHSIFDISCRALSAGSRFSQFLFIWNLPDTELSVHSSFVCLFFNSWFSGKILTFLCFCNLSRVNSPLTAVIFWMPSFSFKYLIFKVNPVLLIIIYERVWTATSF